LNASSRAPEGARLARVAEAIGKEVDSAHGRLEHLMRYELARRASAR